MTATTTTKDITEITRDDVASVYSGRPGCACGCRGNHSENPSSKTRILNVMREHAEQVEVNNGFFSLQTETRLYVVYLK